MAQAKERSDPCLRLHQIPVHVAKYARDNADDLIRVTAYPSFLLALSLADPAEPADPNQSQLGKAAVLKYDQAYVEINRIFNNFDIDFEEEKEEYLN